MSGGVLKAVRDRSAVRWVAESLRPWWQGLPTVGELVPERYEGYARLLHPASGAEGEPARWSRVAERSGRELHPTVLFEDLASSMDGERSPFTSPHQGELPRSICARLAPFFSRSTSTPELSWYCVWAGWGSIKPEKRPVKIRKDLGSRTYLLYRGPVAAVKNLEFEVEASVLYTVSGSRRDRHGARRRPPTVRHSTFQSPAFWWPEDRAWFLATEIDAVSTYIGGSAELIDRLLADSELEVLPARLDDPFDGVHPDMRSPD